MKRKFFEIIGLITIIAFVSIGCGSDSSSSSDDGLGTAANPFLVTNEAELRKVGTGTDGWGLDKHYKLMENIDLTGKANWTPIGYFRGDGSGGYDYAVFSGSFDGNNKTIKGIKINDTSNTANSRTVGMFAIIDGPDCIVKNLNLLDVDVNILPSNAGAVGGIVGLGGEGITITNCYVTGSVKGGEDVGGVVGTCGDGNATVTNCYAAVNVEGNECVGGIIGHNEGGNTVTNCYVTGSVKGDEDVGGIVGLNEGSVENCVVLNSSIIRTSGTEPTFGCVIGYNDSARGGTYSNIYSSNITLPSGVASVNGTNITTWNPAWFESIGFTDTWWTGKLPTYP